jgi:hypothetical protein
MKQILLVAAVAAVLTACATPAQQTAWGKPNVSKVDYGTDVGMCTGFAAMAASGNGANTAGGINGANGSVQSRGGDAARTGGRAGSGPSGGAFPTGGGGAYRDSAPPDVVSRAATQQRTQDMAAARARTEALSSCLTERGYTEFKLTSEQRAHLATLKEGSNEYHQYLYQLGADPEVVKAQAAKKGS